MKNSLLFWFLLINNFVFSQTPFTNKIWELDTKLSNEFDFNKGKNISIDSQLRFFNSNKSNYMYPNNWINKYTLYDYYLRNPNDLNYHSLSTDTGNFELTTTGELRLKVNKLNSPKLFKYFKVDWDKYATGIAVDSCLIDSFEKSFDFSSGSIMCRNRTKIPYYLEISFKLPINNSGTQFDFYNYADSGVLISGQPSGANKLVWSEIDIFEYSGSEKLFTHNVHYKPVGNQPHYILNNTNFTQNNERNIKYSDLNWIKADGLLNYTEDTTMKNGFHKIGIEVTKYYISYYLDDKQTDFVYFPGDLQSPDMNNFSYFPSGNYKQPRLGDNLSIELDAIAGSGFFTNDTPNNNSVFPIVYDIDYIRYYKFKSSMLNDFDFVEQYFNLNNYSEELYKNVIFGNDLLNESVKFGVYGSTTVRAQDYILLRDGVFIDSGNEIYFLDTQKDNK